MASRQPSGDLGHVLPFIKLTRAKLRELAANDEKQGRKLSAHDEAFGLLYRDLETLQTLMQAQVNAINETLAKIRGRLNGR
jgi:hypothetical protein